MIFFVNQSTRIQAPSSTHLQHGSRPTAAPLLALLCVRCFFLNLILTRTTSFPPAQPLSRPQVCENKVRTRHTSSVDPCRREAAGTGSRLCFPRLVRLACCWAGAAQMAMGL